jgi:N-acylneuraminate cytidylyltransferase
MKTIAIIPARGGSKRLPGKNLAMLGDRNLVEHSIAFAKANSTFVDHIVLSTDDAAIGKLATTHDIDLVERPASLATDTSSTVDVLQHVLSLKHYQGVSTVILLQPTNPLRPKNLLVQAMEVWQTQQLDSLFTCSPMHQKFGTINGHHFKPKNYVYGQRSQDLEPLFYENGLLYVSSAASIKKGQMIDQNHHAMVVDHEYARIDIDHATDLDYARYIWARDNPQ